MNRDLTTGNIPTSLLKFAFPLMIGNVLQQFYNLADTLIVGRVLGTDALAAVGSSYTLMTFLTSILIGLCMGSSAYFSIQFGRKNYEAMNKGIFLSFILIGLLTLILNILVFILINQIIKILQVPAEIREMIKEYLLFIFIGITATFLYNFFANLLRAVGNSVIPLVFLGISVALNTILDILFVCTCQWGIRGAASATVISQFIAGIGIMVYSYLRFPMLRVKREHMHWDNKILKNIFSLSFLTCLQQSVMNLGILIIQGLVNSFGTVIMAAFAASVKIDTIAYMPVQDFGNAFSTFDSALISIYLCFLCGHQPSGLSFCQTANGYLCRGRKSGGDPGRCRLSQSGSRLLSGNRTSFYALWILPCGAETRDVCDPDHLFPGNQNNTCIFSFWDTIYWSYWNLDRHSDRLDPC